MATTPALKRSTPVRRWTWRAYQSCMATCAATKIYSNQLSSHWSLWRFFCTILCWNLRILRFLSIRVSTLKWSTTISSWLGPFCTSCLFKFRIKCFRIRLGYIISGTGICWRGSLISRYRSLWVSRKVFTRKISLFQAWHRTTTSEVSTKRRNWGPRSKSCKRW